MTNSELVKQYKETKDKNILNNIYTILRPFVISRAKYVYYKQYYPLSNYYNKDIKGTFNLSKSNLCEYLDVENDLWMEVLRIIDKYDTNKDFDIYFRSCLWNWRPSFLNANFISSLSNKSITNEGEEENQLDILVEPDKLNLEKEEIITEKKENLKQLKKGILECCETENETKVFSILLKDNKINQSEIAKKVKISQPAVNKIIKKIRKKFDSKL